MSIISNKQELACISSGLVAQSTGPYKEWSVETRGKARWHGGKNEKKNACPDLLPFLLLPLGTCWQSAHRFCLHWENEREKLSESLKQMISKWDWSALVRWLLKAIQIHFCVAMPVEKNYRTHFRVTISFVSICSWKENEPPWTKLMVTDAIPWN